MRIKGGELSQPRDFDFSDIQASSKLKFLKLSEEDRKMFDLQFKQIESLHQVDWDENVKEAKTIYVKEE